MSLVMIGIPYYVYSIPYLGLRASGEVSLLIYRTSGNSTNAVDQQRYSPV